MQKQVRIATRSSRLAIAQANLVVAALHEVFPETECVLCLIETTGDKLLDLNLAVVGGKGLFLKEIEQSLLAEECDIAVHSMKDVPVFLPDGLVIPAVLQRGDSRDALLSLQGHTIASLPEGSSVGTCSSRRAVVLKSMRPDLNIVPIRGNIGSRIKKLQEGQYDAIVLAICGLQRANLVDTPYSIIPAEVMVPAIGQGVVGIECRQDDGDMMELLAKINHKATFEHVSIERDFMKAMEADCTTPIGGYVVEHKDGVRLLTYYNIHGGKEVVETFDGKAEEVVRQALQWYDGKHKLHR